MRVLLLAFLLCLPCGVMAQHPEAVKSETVTPDAGPAGTDQQIQENTARLDAQERMSGDQRFMLDVLGIIVPSIGLIAVALIQLANNRKLETVAKSVNGMKHELVNEVRKGALLQGAETERAKGKGKATKGAS